MGMIQYAVLLWNDEDHTHTYVIRMMVELFGHTEEEGDKIVDHLNDCGSVACFVTTREHAELKVDQIHAFGQDPNIKKRVGSMTASLAPIII